MAKKEDDFPELDTKGKTRLRRWLDSLPREADDDLFEEGINPYGILGIFPSLATNERVTRVATRLNQEIEKTKLDERDKSIALRKINFARDRLIDRRHETDTLLKKIYGIDSLYIFEDPEKIAEIIGVEKDDFFRLFYPVADIVHKFHERAPENLTRNNNYDPNYFSYLRITPLAEIEGIVRESYPKACFTLVKKTSILIEMPLLGDFSMARDRYSGFQTLEELAKGKPKIFPDPVLSDENEKDYPKRFDYIVSFGGLVFEQRNFRDSIRYHDELR